MSVRMDDSDNETDYSSFEYQQIAVSHEDTSPSGNTNSRAKSTFEILGESGGLDTNEVAELVYAEVYADLEAEDEDGDQDAGTFAELRGSFGTDLEERDEVENPINEDGTTEVTSNIGPDTGNVEVNAFNISRPEVFQVFRAVGGLPFDDDTNGPGGGASTAPFHAEKSWRSMTGRGPVLDSTDDITLVTNVIAGDTVIPVAGIVRCHLVWDVATVDEAGARFSVPM